MKKRITLLGSIDALSLSADGKVPAIGAGCSLRGLVRVLLRHIA